MAHAPPRLVQRSMTSTGLSEPGAHVPKIFTLQNEYLKNDVESIQQSITDHVEYTLACTKYNFNQFAAFQATAASCRDRMIEYWNDTQQYYTETDPKRVYYLSLEFLMGRSLNNAVYNMGVEEPYKEALMDLSYRLEDLYEEEKDAALGNGGLGRLAACFMDSAATLNLPCWGYGLRYKYGMFEQVIHDGWQTELPDYWLTDGNPWEIDRKDVFYPVKFYGKVIAHKEGNQVKYSWENAEIVEAEAYDIPIPGYGTNNTNNIRLWSSRPHKEFDLEMFNRGDYFSAVESKQKSENITSVLYPNDSTIQGKELRLKQQYFFCAATLSDIIRRFKKIHGSNFEEFPNKVIIQLNDTHPTISIVELMRKLIDEEGFDWQTSWSITQKSFAYTNHTILPEALEHWPIHFLESLLPRHMQLIYEINDHFLKGVSQKYPGDVARLRDMSIIAESHPKQIRMANLAIIGSCRVNGVAALHTNILKNQVFKNFFEYFPEKFVNITNGVTPRRWIQQSNPSLSTLLTKWLETPKWATELNRLADLRKFADNSAFIAEWKEMKIINKMRLSEYIAANCNIEVDPMALFDVHIKRIHEYKRQLLNILGVIHRYLKIKKTKEADRKSFVPRVFIFGGKAAAAYHMAKTIIKLINSVAAVINADTEIDGLIKVVYIANYNVSLAEIIIPASDINQQISTTGTEASGTGNMKFALNGSLILGTLDGANVELAEEMGEENMFIFGFRHPHEVDVHRTAMSEHRGPKMDDRLVEVLDKIKSGTFGPAEYFADVISYFNHDFYAIIPDFPSYLTAQENVDKLYVKEDEWMKKSIISSASCAKFSSDRSISEYASQIWNATAQPLPKSLIRWGARKHAN